MKNSKEETIRLYTEDYLKDKSEDKRNEFFAKPAARQYSAIMAWKRRNELRDKPKEASAADIIKLASALPSMIENAENFSDKELERLHEIIDAAKDRLNNFHRIRNTRELRALQRTQEEIRLRIEALRSEGVVEE